jgi:hypothetical protein
VISALWLFPSLTLFAQPVDPPATLLPDRFDQGFRYPPRTLSFQFSGGYGLKAFGSTEAHHLALAHLSYGHPISGLLGREHWYRGNWELRGELFGGIEFSPSDEWLIGLTPHLRYNLATGKRWSPFIDGGAGVTATSIGPPDLSNTFEFNVQGGGGLHYLLRPNLALTVEARYVHLSCARLSEPNLGLNSLLGVLGLTWLF